jgi:hypothetical protein
MPEPGITRRSSRPIVIAVAVSVAVVATACSGGEPATGGPGTTPPAPVPRPSSPATLTILSPRNGQVITGSTVHVRVALVGAHIVAATTTHITPTQGHLHVFLDNKIVSMNYKPNGVIANVSPGQHTLRVEFVASDHRPFDPRVFKGVVFEVKS